MKSSSTPTAFFGGVKLSGHPDPSNLRLMDANIIEPINRMQRFGVAIDVDYLRDLASEFGSHMAELKREIISYIPPENLEQFMAESEDSELDFNPNSPAQKAELIFKILDLGAGHKLKTTKSGKFVTDRKQLEKLRRSHPVISKLLAYSEYGKLKSTYCEGMPKLAKLHNHGLCNVCGANHLEPHYRIHTDIPTTRTDTGRLASRRPNLQNIPARTEAGRRVRKAFKASAGKSFVTRDYSQIELRWLADRANAASLIRVFTQNIDPHTDTACRAFHKDPEEVESKIGKLLYRAPCKNVNFGVCYGLQGPGLYDLMAVTYAVSGIELPDWLTADWCVDFIEQWFNLYPEVKEYLDVQSYRAKRYGITWCAFGGVRRIPEIHSAHERIRSAGIRQAGNNPIQRGAAGIFKLGLARTHHCFEELRRSGTGVELLLPIHDELLAEVDSESAETVAALMGWEMEHALMSDDGQVHCRVPILTDGNIGQEWVK